MGKKGLCILRYFDFKVKERLSGCCYVRVSLVWGEFELNVSNSWRGIGLYFGDVGWKGVLWRKLYLRLV